MMTIPTHEQERRKNERLETLAAKLATLKSLEGTHDQPKRTETTKVLVGDGEGQTERLRLFAIAFVEHEIACERLRE